MSAHTPGPWKFLDVIGGCSVYAGRRQVLAYHSSPDAENKANARLIAAAPDLLDALQAAVASGIIDHDGEPDAARAAIAKATGSPA